ncbi:MAG TPA: streptomycin biosynthesis protein, partial [Pseudonocardiaceae bacterium]
ELNHAHGLPLSLADRTAAAARVIDSHPEWSDRRIAAVTGLAGNTVGAIRGRSASRAARSGARVGRDGKTRPGNAVQGRLLASELIADNPDASLRDIAKAAGMSPATVSDVRARLARGESPVTPRQRVAALDNGSPATRDTRRASVIDHGDLVARLRSDPSLRFTEGGRILLRVLDVCAFDAAQWQRIGASVPSHHRAAIVALVRRSAGMWQEFAERLANPASDVGDAARAR